MADLFKTLNSPDVSLALYFRLKTETTFYKNIFTNPSSHSYKTLSFSLPQFDRIPAVLRKAFASADCDTICTIYLSLCTHKADPNSPNPFRGIHGSCVLWDGYILFITRVYSEGTIFMKPAVAPRLRLSGVTLRFTHKNTV